MMVPMEKYRIYVEQTRELAYEREQLARAKQEICGLSHALYLERARSKREREHFEKQVACERNERMHAIRSLNNALEIQQALSDELEEERRYIGVDQLFA